ncbi:MAG TPA: hypothetical protein VLK82_13905 [Candidatus Tectomicrobia bacterium]|nr:hypothetical protein [Candidatus Tectomicrobia bacterium]
MAVSETYAELRPLFQPGPPGTAHSIARERFKTAVQIFAWSKARIRFLILRVHRIK